MAKQGYAFERFIELWACRILGQDPKADFFKRSYRTATSGARGDGDVRVRSHDMPFLVLVECKHRQYTIKGDYAFRLNKSVLDQVISEAKGSKEPWQKFATPTVCFAFKGSVKNRVWFIIPEGDAKTLFFETHAGWFTFSPHFTVKKSRKGEEYIVVTRASLDAPNVNYVGVVDAPEMGRLWFVSQQFMEKLLTQYDKASVADSPSRNIGEN